MFAFTDFSEIATVSHSIAATNPAIVTRLRKQAARFTPNEIAACLAGAIANAADAAHARAWEEAQHGEASPDTIVDDEYYHDLAAAWALVATEHQISSLEGWLAGDSPLH